MSVKCNAHISNYQVKNIILVAGNPAQGRLDLCQNFCGFDICRVPYVCIKCEIQGIPVYILNRYLSRYEH